MAGKLLPRRGHGNVIRLPARDVAALSTATLGLWTIVLAAIDTLVSHSDRSNASKLAVLLTPVLQLAIGLMLMNRPWIVADKFTGHTIQT